MTEQATAPQAQAEDAPEAPQAEPKAEQFDEARALEKIRKANSEAANLRKRLQELEPLAAKAKELEEAGKTEQQRLEERASAAEREREELAAQVARLTVAARYSIPAELIDLLGAGTADEIESRAKLLAERIGTPASPSSRPVESLKPGAAPANGKPQDPDAWLRQMAGR